MGLETGSNISDLNELWPVKEDGISQADDHFRLIKNVLKNTFSNVISPVLSSSTEINFLQGATSSIQNQINFLSSLIGSGSSGSIMIGGIINFNGPLSSIPANWQLCDGTNGTPNMTNKFVYGTNSGSEIRAEGGSANAVNVSHSHSASHGHSGSADPDPDNSGFPTSNNVFGGFTGTVINTSQTSNSLVDNSSNEPHAVNIPNTNVTTSSSGVSGVDKNIPPYVKLAYIQRMS